MKYEFPHIFELDDVLPHIAGYDEFVVAQKDGYTVINYVVVKPETFSRDCEGWEVRRECRGLIFYNTTGLLISRPFHKFFNVNERDETQSHVIDITKDHVVYEKLDGSMVRPFNYGDGIRLGTKMGITDTSMRAETWLASHEDSTKIVDRLRDIDSLDITPIFEWIDPIADRIVVEYPEPQLVCTAMRHTFTGEYISLDRVAELIDGILPMCPAYGYVTSNSLADYVNLTRDAYGREGDVIRFDDGHMIKIKSDWYVDLHKTKELISSERHIISLALDNNLDDVIGVLPSNDIDRIHETVRQFWYDFREAVNYFNAQVDGLCGEWGDNVRDIAIAYKGAPKQNFSVVMAVVRGNETEDVVMKAVRKALNSNKKYDEMRKWLKGE